MTGLVLLLAAFGVGCTGSDVPEPEVLHEASDRRYTLKVEESRADPDRRRLELRLRPSGAWKIASEYPTKLRVAPPGEAVSDLRRDEATVWSEAGVDFTFDRPVAAGTTPVSLAFAVCHGDVCERVTEDFELAPAQP